ncbi:hypothetical protein HDU96_006845 [Phlyctochytrium bullatum]|nr:hypothetical protein HDU96_006845 [Phlyctochytrium bullatum]
MLAAVAYVTTLSISKTFLQTSTSAAGANGSGQTQASASPAEITASSTAGGVVLGGEVLKSRVAGRAGDEGSLAQADATEGASSTSAIGDNAPAIQTDGNAPVRTPATLPQSHSTNPSLPTTSPTPQKPILPTDDLASGELLALSLATLLGSFFLCFASSGSISRSALLASQTDARSHVASLVAVLVVCAVLAWMSSFLAFVPLPCLAAVILLAMSKVIANITLGIDMVKEALGKAREAEAVRPRRGISGVLRTMAVGADAVVWWATFFAVVVLDAGSGIAIGIITVFVSNLVKATSEKLDA